MNTINSYQDEETYHLEDPMPHTSVLFVCLGNICRSPLAEGVFRGMVCQAGLADQIKVDSCGTGDWNVGRPPHQGSQTVAAAHGIDISELRARQITSHDLATFEWIIAMDNSNVANIRRIDMPSGGAVHKLLSFADNVTTTEVPDPYYKGGFDGVYQLIVEGCTGLFTHVTTKQ